MDKKAIHSAIESIEMDKNVLADKITDLHFKKNPSLEKKYGHIGRERCREDAIFHLEYLIQAMQIESRELFHHYLEWAWQMLDARNIPKVDLIHNLRYIGIVLSGHLQAEEYNTAAPYLEDGEAFLEKITTDIESYIKPEKPLFEEASRYLELLLSGKRDHAKGLIDSLVKNGVPIKDIYEHIFQTTQYEVGILWQQNKITVAHEHYCTAATQLIMSGLYPIIFSGSKKGLRLVACSVARELHEIGIRMVSDFFEMDGWDTYYMGSNMPDAHLLTAIREYEAQLLAISVTLPIHIQKVEHLISKIRSVPEFNNLKIMAGGYPFNVVPGLSSKIGADASALTANEAVQMANKMME